jgi:hypothetical protein
MKAGKFIVILLLAASAAYAQHLSVGIDAGVPFTGGLSDFTSPDGAYRTFSNSKEYIFGPMVEVRLPLSLAIEVDALYRPINATTDILAAAVRLTGPAETSNNVSTWEFPVLGKYRFAFPIVKPFIEAGPSFRATGSGLGWFSNHGFTMGGGIELKVLRLRIAPAIRYTHWGSDTPPPINASFFAPSSQNQGEFLVGLSF